MKIKLSNEFHGTTTTVVVRNCKATVFVAGRSVGRHDDTAEAHAHARLVGGDVVITGTISHRAAKAARARLCVDGCACSGALGINGRSHQGVYILDQTRDGYRVEVYGV